MPNSKRADGEERKERGSLDELWKLVDGIETARRHFAGTKSSV